MHLLNPLFSGTDKCVMETRALKESNILSTDNLPGCDATVVNALIAVAGTSDGFLPSGEPLIRFHRDVFSKRTIAVYDNLDPDISNPEAGGYDDPEVQHQRLHKAILLDKDAALMSTGWGKFQLMGHSYSLCGYHSLQDFVSAMYESETEQLNAFINYLRNLSLDEDLKNKDWFAFATKYPMANDKREFADKLLQAYSNQ